MAKWVLIKTTKDGAYNCYRKENETVYHYRSGDKEVAFHSHPDKPFQWVPIKGEHHDVLKVIAEFTHKGLKQYDYKGGFDEAIKELNI